MELQNILSPDSVVTHLKAGSKRQLLQELAAIGARLVDRDEHDVLEILQQREKLGSTGVGNGVAIPHGKLPGIERIVGVFARLSKPLDFDAMDDQPIDIAFMLLAPEGSGADHLKALSRAARLLRDGDKLEAIRASDDPARIYDLVIAEQRANAA